MPSQFCPGSTSSNKYINLETSKPVVARKCTSSSEVLENENKYKSGSSLKLSFSALRSLSSFSRWFWSRSVWVAFSINNNSTVKFIPAQLSDSSEESDATQLSSSHCFGAGHFDIGLSLGQVKDLNLEIEGTASSVYTFLVLSAAFSKCSSSKWYSHITAFLLDGSIVSPPPLLRYILIVLTQLWYFWGCFSLDGNLKKPISVLFPNLLYLALPHSGAQQYFPRPPDMSLEVEDLPRFWLREFISTWQ